jgi:hypothetical protein
MTLKGGRWSILPFFAWLLLFAGSALPGLANEDAPFSGKAGSGFMWVEPEQDRPLWSKVEEAFRQELSPDPPTAPGSHEMVCGYKFVHRIGVCNDSALVLIAARGERSDPPELDGFRVFTYDFRTSRKSRVTPHNGFMYWRFAGLVRIDSSSVPDVLFTHDQCVECEGAYYLSSFRFDAKDNEWKLRIWPHDGADLLIGGANKDHPQKIFEYICLYSLQDFNGDRLNDIAICCRERETITGAEKDNVVLYTNQRGVPAEINPEAVLLKTIKGELCRQTPASPLCASGK